MFRPFVIRDAAILIATVLAWWGSSATDGGTSLVSALSIAAGAGAAVCAYNLHEWRAHDP
jgi:hypothetical protein